jgi:hypothetical protein
MSGGALALVSGTEDEPAFKRLYRAGAFDAG